MKPPRIPPPLLACGILLIAPPAAAAAVETAGHVRAEREHAFTVPLPPAGAFTFFEPLGEKNWAEGWHPVFATPDDARLHDGSVFTVEAKSPEGSPLHSVWAVSRYEPPRLIEYRNVLTGLRATQITVRCEPGGPGATRVTVRYVYHGLSPEGDALIGQITPEVFRSNVDGWGAAITAYLKRGTPATP